MRKFIMIFTVWLMMSLAGCSDANGNVIHQDGNLIVTNYSDQVITDIAVIHGGETVSVSPEGIKSTQICYFTVEPSVGYVYTVSFVDSSGEEHSREFTDNFTEDTPILIAVRWVDNVWTIGYDR